MAETNQQTTMYDWIGGEEGLRKLVNRFYDIMDSDEQAKHGSPCITKQHKPFVIDQAASDAWMNCMKQAMIDVDIDEKFRDMLTPAFQRICDTLLNA